MILATQYYRPPFPERRRWKEDLRAIRATGFDAVVVTAYWAWMEPAPGEFDFTDTDAFVEDAARAGLRVIVNTWSELQPVWIHREVPGAEMINHLGQPVVSSPLAYAQFGIMPGGCTDHPQIRARAAGFLTATAQRYAAADAVMLWDCWNEIRWLTQADGYVCRCGHTVERFHSWLRGRYGDLDGLNRAWRRRYRDWADVQPTDLPSRTYTDAVAFQAFLTDRAAEDLAWRYGAVRAGDPERPILAHTAFPSVYCTGEFFAYEPALARGVDADLAEAVDAFGSSHFPAWIHRSPIDYGNRLEATRSASGGKPVWIAELQGGAAGHGLQAMSPVPGSLQARWVWNGIARGAKGISFWSWRDEVFGREAGGFGIAGDDGHRDERLAKLRRTADLLAEHQELFDSYVPAPAQVGVVLEPSAYHLDWASDVGGGLTGAAENRYQAGHSVQGYLRALERLRVDYDVVDPAHAGLDRYRLLIMPWTMVVRPEFGERVVAWVRAGGRLVVEADAGAYDADGLYHYPDERPFAAALGLGSLGRRPLDDRPLRYRLAGVDDELRCAGWLAPHRPGGAEELAADDRGATVVRCRVGEGSVVSVGTFAGLAYWRERYAGFERFVDALTREAGCDRLRCDHDGETVPWRHGRSGSHTLLFVLNEGEAGVATFTGPADVLGAATTATDLTTGVAAGLCTVDGRVELRVALDAGAYHVLRLTPAR